MYSLKDKEGTIINNVREDFFKEYDCRKLIGNIDFSVAIPQTGKELFPEIEYVLWAEAKKGALSPSAFHDAFIQLIFTIGRERTFDKNLPPKFLGAFDAEKIAFIPFSAVMEVFSQNDFDWTVAPSDHESKEFKQLKEMVKKQLTETGKENENVYFFNFFNDKKDLQRFIKKNFVSGRDSVQRMRITYNNFTHIYEKWRKEVMPSIAVNWDNAKKNGLLDADFYLADIMSGDNETILENLHVLLKSNHYELDRKIDTDGLWASKSVPFNDNMAAHSRFWSKYTRPPKKEYWDKIVERRDLLVPQDIRERKGSYFTPRIWVEKSQEYLADVLGEDWQENYYVWDCCAGTGNLLAGLTNKYNIWASTLDQADVDVMHQRIEEMGDGSNLLKAHVFKFDFLNDDFSKIPDEGLRDILNDEEKRKRLVIYINPPYAEAGTATQVTGKGENKVGVSNNSLVWQQNKDRFGLGIRELYVQFFVRIYQEIPGATLAEFSKLKILQGSAFADFRSFFLAKLERLFVVPAKSFDNVSGSFPIGFFIWNTSKKEPFSEIMADIYENENDYLGQKKISIDSNDTAITKWISSYGVKEFKDVIGYTGNTGPDFQHNQYLYIISRQGILKSGHPNNETKYSITRKNLIPISIYISVRLCSPATWLNDRDQFLFPNDGWKFDHDFQSDCLAYTLFHGQNRISSTDGINHWIPFTEQQVNAPNNFKSHFMSDFIAGKLKPQNTDTLFGEEESLIPTEPIQFTPAAQAVMEAGRKIWGYYLHKNDKVLYAEPVNVNASFYDIRAYFQGRDEKGKMNSDSDDPTYMSLLKELRTYQKVLAKQIEKKVYLYGFLKGEVEVDPMERLNELQKENEELKHKLHAQQTTVINQIHIDTYNDNSKHISLDKE
jgi:hypothetical protein